jgi:hypothetical protein
MTRTFIGLRECDGWRFTLTPSTNADGSPGFTRETITPRKGWRADVQRTVDANKIRADSDVIRALQADLDAGKPPADWVEERWLTEWLRAGAIREVK